MVPSFNEHMTAVHDHHFHGMYSDMLFVPNNCSGLVTRAMYLTQLQRVGVPTWANCIWREAEEDAEYEEYEDIDVAEMKQEQATDAGEPCDLESVPTDS